MISPGPRLVRLAYLDIEAEPRVSGVLLFG
jgi:hypothetical protein